MAGELESVYAGTERKYKVEIDAQLPMEELDLVFDIYCGRVHIRKTQTDLVPHVNGNQIDYYLIIDTTPFCRGGVMYILTTVSVPDSDERHDERMTEIHRSADLLNVIPNR